MNNPITEIKTKNEFESAFKTLSELRTGMTYEEFETIYKNAKLNDSFTFVGMFENEKCIALMGYRILFDYVHGKHLYIDDLIVTARYRSKGIGAKFLTFAEEKAKELHCKGLRLCTGIDRKDSQRFYEKNHWSARAIAFKKTL